MPVHRTTSQGQPAWQYGTQGKKYTYKAGSKASREAAKKKAIKQGLAEAYAQKRKPTL